MRRFHRAGDAVSFKLVGVKRIIDAPKRWFLLHDAYGEAWPACSALVGRVPLRGSRPATEEELEGAPGWYLGDDYEARVATLPELPPRWFDGWKRVGEVERIWYYRYGKLETPEGYQHGFGERTLLNFFRKSPKPVLWRRKGWYRLELGAGCKWDDRGIIAP